MHVDEMRQEATGVSMDLGPANAADLMLLTAELCERLERMSEALERLIAVVGLRYCVPSKDPTAVIHEGEDR